jgi:hypothetical protein
MIDRVAPPGKGNLRRPERLYLAMFQTDAGADGD